MLDAENADDDFSDVELIAPEDFLPRNPFPVDAQRMGIDRWSDDAGLIAIAASLDPGRSPTRSSPGSCCSRSPSRSC